MGGVPGRSSLARVGVRKVAALSLGLRKEHAASCVTFWLFLKVITVGTRDVGFLFFALRGLDR